MTSDDLATLPAWAAAELRRQAEEIAALRAALEGAEKRAQKMKRALRHAEHKIDQTMHGQYPRGQALESALWVVRDVLVAVDDAGRGKEGK